MFFIGGLEEIRLIKDALRPAVARNSPPDCCIIIFESPLRKYHTKYETPPNGWCFIFGGLEEIRTPDPHNANVVRSQLRYEPVDTANYTAVL